MKSYYCIAAVIAMSFWQVGCASSKAKPSIAKASLGPSPVEEYEQQLAERIAAGEKPPVVMQDPIDGAWALVFCEDLTDQEKSSKDLVPFDLGYICQNTVVGEQLLSLRKWKCGERTGSACICGGKRGRDFYDVNYQLSRFGGGVLGKQGTDAVATLCRVDE